MPFKIDHEIVKSEGLDEFSDRPLDEEEIKALRRLLLHDDRARWLWSSVRIWLFWIASIAGGVYALQEYIAKLLRKA